MKAYIAIFAISLSLGLYLFFSNPWLSTDFNSDSYGWFIDFSHSIFQPHTAYYAESILLPLLGKIIGASKSILLYKSLCAILTIGILPITGLLALRYFKSFYKAAAFILLFGLSFQYFKYFILGFPDPLTILLLLAAIFQKRAIAIFCLLSLAMLSHFSMAAISVVALFGLVYFSPINKEVSVSKYCGTMIAALIAGKLILLAWYSLFHYRLQSRLDWVLEKGHPYFLERYLLNEQAFWLTPGVFFIALYGSILIYFLLRRQFLFVMAGIGALILAYLALFWTVDGLRVFAVIIAAPYAYLLATAIQGIQFPQAKIFSKSGT